MTITEIKKAWADFARETLITDKTMNKHQHWEDDDYYIPERVLNILLVLIEAPILYILLNLSLILDYQTTAYAWWVIGVYYLILFRFFYLFHAHGQLNFILNKASKEWSAYDYES